MKSFPSPSHISTSIYSQLKLQYISLLHHYCGNNNSLISNSLISQRHYSRRIHHDKNDSRLRGVNIFEGMYCHSDPLSRQFSTRLDKYRCFYLNRMDRPMKQNIAENCSFLHKIQSNRQMDQLSTMILQSIKRHYGRKVVQDEYFDIYDNSDENAMPDFPVTPKATWVFFQHIVKYFNENAWEYHGLKDVIKGLLVDFRVHLEKVMMVKEEREAQVVMSSALGDRKVTILDSESDPEDINEIVKNQTPGKIIKAKLRDLVSDPEIERTVYANFLIEVAQRITSVYKESLQHITDDVTKDFTKEQFGDLISCLELHIHSMINLTMSPEIPDWTFEKYKLVSGPVLYNYLLEAAVELGDGYVYGNLLRKMKDDHVGLNQYSFQLMMRFGEKATKNNAIYAEELMKYMKEREIEPDKETINTYNRIMDKYSDKQEEKVTNFQHDFQDVYNESLAGSNSEDTLPKVQKSSTREVLDQLDFQTDESENLLREALNSDKYKVDVEDKYSSSLGSGFESELPEELKFDEDFNENDDIIKKIVEGETGNNFSDDLPPPHDSFGSNMAQWYKQQRPHNHPSKKPVLPDYSLDEEEENKRTIDIFSKYKENAQRNQTGSDASAFKEIGSAKPLSFKKEIEDDYMRDDLSEVWNKFDGDEVPSSKMNLNDGDINILKKFGLSPEELASSFQNTPGSKEDLEDVKKASNQYQTKLQEKAKETDSAYAVKERFYDTGFFDPYSQPIQGYDPSIADSFTEEDFVVEDPYKKDFNRKNFTKKEALISDSFDAYAGQDFEAEMRMKAQILEKQKEKEREKEREQGGKNEQGPDTWCDPTLKL